MVNILDFFIGSLYNMGHDSKFSDITQFKDVPQNVVAK